MNEKELQELRASLIQFAKALETERACILRIIHLIERQTNPMSDGITNIQKESDAAFVKSVV